jgi:SAM-dependent methyltransferase
MKQRLASWLECPACHGSFDLEALAGHDDVVETGWLRCACRQRVPIIQGIPRFVDDWPARFPAFASRYGHTRARAATASQGSGAFDAWQRATRRSFGYQWTKFGQMSCDFRENFFNYVAPLRAEDFAGRLVLDVGCGFGRHLVNAARCGAEVVGVDLSFAVDAARRNLAAYPNAQVVQADLRALPQ